MSQPQLPTRVLAGVIVPDTPLITKAIALARKYLDDQGYKHIMRSWLIGQASFNNTPTSQRSTIDEEVFAVSTILHDLGWSKSPDVTSKDKQFEVDGANAARAFLLSETNTAEWDKHRIQLVWDSIAFHTSSIAPFKEAEVATCSAAIVTELVGVQVATQLFGDNVTVTQQEFDTIASEFPREGLKGYIRDMLCGLCREKPASSYNTFVGQYGDRFVEGFSSKGNQMADLFEATVTE
ncbi:hypothetical protein K504DRAFT_510956 [Pleomassaria siparia CBS 279.74]|uniref:HD domain-containing protein n=1 Tax=Pleomassaria siparia CBS 279.74 TaxID=1314801 RepID=A0A6G1KRX9_9PLEO|nr:hypothetical protein K504DRAFT_510956 [Pleomassaria siparia CBS 279.74]